MLRVGTNILNRLTATESKCGNSAFALEFVRWRRKPRWLPVAKSKQNRIIVRKRQDPDERAELMRLHNNYKTQMRTIYQYFRGEAQRIKETSTVDHIVLTSEQEEAEYQHCLDVNNEWNKKIAEERDARLAKERQERAELIRERLEAARIRQEEQMEAIEAIVRREKEASKTFITREKLDAAIEYALANPIDHNFSIDLQGNIYRGRATVPGGSGTPSTVTDEDDKKFEATN